MNFLSKNVILLSVLLSPVIDAAEVKKSLQIMPGKIHENCFVLAPNESIKYTFNTTSDVAFNIHYHSGDQVKYPVKLKSVSNKSDSFKATIKQNYCLMWTNNSKQSTQLSYSYRKTK